MCGIAGIFQFDGRSVDKKILHRMDTCVSHRGPDGHGEFILNNVGLANRRLAIIDPRESGNQPLSLYDKSLWITFNGEIFNYKSLREELKSYGHSFLTETDTEVILVGFKEFGEKIVEKLLGQFALCIYDMRKKAFFLARDHLGINPLFYFKGGNTFLFASEVKSILSNPIVSKEINKEALYHYTSIFATPTPLTIIKGVYSLPPGHFMWVGRNGLRIKKFWHLPTFSAKRNVSYENEKEKLRELLLSSVSLTTVSDVPVGAFLSGGIDSSLVVALMANHNKKRVKTYSLWADEGKGFDEREFARLVSKKFHTDHTEYTIGEKEIFTEFENFIYFLDQPNGESFETYFLSKVIGNDVKVALSGLGGDELFGGYHGWIYRTNTLSTFYKRVPKKLTRNVIQILSQFPLLNCYKKTFSLIDRFLRLPTFLEKRLFFYFAYFDQEKKRLFSSSFLEDSKYNTRQIFSEIFESSKATNEIDKLSFMDLSTYTRDNLLITTNMASMAHSLEVRVPLLDKRLVEYAFSLPYEFKVKNGIQKYILKEVAKEWLPKEIIDHKKTGFGFPRKRYMKGILKPLILEALSPSSIKKRGIFNEKYVNDVVQSFYTQDLGKTLWTDHLRVWTLFIFELWARRYLD
ncbi:asparagine synthase (glutamine-hydrolyzing) [Candidatus Gottesmanbacteria bacterium]|nr:asparagine synthase (glutamine-hydrolyzing) [Candidatus Gottesmanbacteria bacterium]